MEDFYTLQLARFNPRDQQLLKFVRGKAESFLASVGPSYFYGVQKDASATVSSLMLSHMQTSADKPAFDPFAFLPASAHESLLAGQTKDNYNAYVVSTRALVYRLVQLLPAEAVITKLVPAVANDTMFAQMYFGRQEHFNLETFVRKTTMHASAAGPQKHVLFVRATLASLYISQVVEKWSADLRAATTVIESEQCQQQRLFEDALRGFVTDARKRMIFIVVNATISREKTTDRVSYMRQVIDDTIYSVQSKLANADAIAAKHFVILLAFPPEQMYISSCYPAVYLRGWQFQFFDTLDSGGAIYIKRFAKTLYGEDDAVSADGAAAMHPEKALFNNMLSEVLFEFCSHLRPPFEVGAANVQLQLLSDDVKTVYSLQLSVKTRSIALQKVLSFVDTIWGELLMHMSSTFSRDAVGKLVQSRALEIITGLDFQSLTDSVASVLQNTLRAFLMIILHEIAADVGLEPLVQLMRRKRQDVVHHLFRLVPLPDSKVLASFQPRLLFLNQPAPNKLFLFRLVQARIEQACKSVREFVSAEQDVVSFVARLKTALDKDSVVKTLFQPEPLDDFVVQSYIHDVVALKSGLVNTANPVGSLWLIIALQRWIQTKAVDMLEKATSGVHIVAIILGNLELHASTFQSLLSSGLAAARHHDSGINLEVVAQQYASMVTHEIEDSLLRGAFDHLWQMFTSIVDNLKASHADDSAWPDDIIANWLDQLHFLTNHFAPGESLPGNGFRQMRTKIDFMLMAAQVLLLDPPPPKTTMANLLAIFHAGAPVHSDGNKNAAPVAFHRRVGNHVILSADAIVNAMVASNANLWVIDMLRWFVRTSNAAVIRDPGNVRCVVLWVNAPAGVSAAVAAKARNTNRFIFNLLAAVVGDDDILRYVTEYLANIASNETYASNRMRYLPAGNHVDRSSVPEVLKSPLADFYFEYAMAAPVPAKETAVLAHMLIKARSEFVRVQLASTQLFKSPAVVRLVLEQAKAHEHVYRIFLAYLKSFPEAVSMDVICKAFAHHGLTKEFLSAIYLQLTSKPSTPGRLLLIARMQQATSRQFTKLFLNYEPVMHLFNEDKHAYRYYLGDPAKVSLPLEDVPSFMTTPMLPIWTDVEVPFPHLYAIYPELHDEMEQAASSQNFAPLLLWCERMRTSNKLKDGECHMLVLLEVHHVFLQRGVANLARLAPLRDLLVNNDATATRQLGLDRFPDHRRALLMFIDPSNHFADWLNHQLGQLFSRTVGTLDWDSARHRHIGANLVALTMGSNSKDHPLWTFLFCPETLINTYPFAWAYTHSPVGQGVHYDCGTVINIDGSLRGPHPDCIERPTVYTAYLFTHMALSFALCMERTHENTRLNLLYPGLLTPDHSNAMDGTTVRAKRVHLPFSRVTGAWIHITDPSRPREDMPLLVNRVLERYAWSVSKGAAPQYKKTFASWNEVTAAEAVFTNLYKDTLHKITEFRINMAEEKLAEMERFTGAYSSSLRDASRQFLQVMNVTATNEHYALLHAFNNDRTHLHLLRELPPILAMYDLLHSSMHGLVEERDVFQQPLQYFIDQDLMRPMDSPVVVSDIINKGVEAFNRVHTGLGGMLRGGVCATQDDFVPIHVGTTPLAYLLTHPASEDNDVLMKVMRALVDKPNSLLEKAVSLYEHVFAASKRDASLQEIFNDRPLKLLLMSMRRSVDNAVNVMDTVTNSQAARLLITADAGRPAHLSFQALAESMRNVVLDKSGVEDTTAPATFDLAKLQQLVLAQEVIGRHSLHLQRVRKPFVFRKSSGDSFAGVGSSKAAVDLAGLVDHDGEGIRDFKQPFVPELDYASMTALDSLGQEDLHSALGDLQMVLTILRDTPVLAPAPTVGIKAWLQAETARASLGWCPDSLRFKHLCTAARRVQENIDRQTHLFVRLPENVRKPLAAAELEQLKGVIESIVQENGLASTIESLTSALETMSQMESFIQANVGSTRVEHTLATFFETMGDDNVIFARLPAAILDVHYANTNLELLTWRGKLLKRQIEARLQSEKSDGKEPEPAATFTKWNENDGAPNLVVVAAASPVLHADYEEGMDEPTSDAESMPFEANGLSSFGMSSQD